MKTSYYNKFLLFLLLVQGSLFFTSCRDESVGLDNVSGDIEVGGSLIGPLVKTSELYLYRLLDTYNSDVEGMIIDTTDVEDIYLTYEKEFSYSMPDINEAFGTFSTEMFNFGISDILGNNEITQLLGKIPLGVVLPNTDEYVNPYPFSCGIEGALNSSTGKEQQVSRIKFENARVEVNITPTFDIKTGSVLKIELQNSKDASLLVVNVAPTEKNVTFTTVKDFTGSEILELTKELTAKFTVKGDGQTIIKATDNIKLSLSCKKINDATFKYTVFGLFNYSHIGQEGVKIDYYIADLHKYIPEGSVLRLEDPKFDFWAESTIGTTLKFDLKQLKAFLYNGSTPDFDPTRDFYIQRATIPGKTVRTDNSTENGFESINSGFFARYSQDISDYLNTQLDSLFVKYELSTETKGVNVPIVEGGNEEFIPSDGLLKIHGKVTSPFAFDKGSVICYTDTFEVDFSSDYFDDVNYINLHFNYENHCPLGFFVELSLLDENNILLPGVPNPYQTVKIERPQVDNKGKVKTPHIAWDGIGGKGIDIKFEKGEGKSSISALRKAKFIKLKYSSEGGANYNSDSAPIRITKNDKIKIQIGLDINGKILLSSDND